MPSTTDTSTATPTLWPEIRDARVEHGALALWWLYQAGFAVKTPGGTTVLVDPYLSDAVVRSYQQPRAVPAPFRAEDVAVDAVLATHSHEDHLDPDSVRGFAAADKTIIIGPRMVTQKSASLGIDGRRTRILLRGDTTEIGDLRVTAVAANHNFGIEPTPDAVGFVLESGGVRVYHSGDTEYDRRIIEDTVGVDASLVCINGTTGNMNVHEAALTAWQQGASLIVPHHYVLWRPEQYGEGATLDPEALATTYRNLGGTGRVHVPVPFRRFDVRRP